MKVKIVYTMVLILATQCAVLFLTTPISGLADTYLMIFIHPVFAWTAYSCFFVSAIYACIYLIKKDSRFSIISHDIMSVSYVFIIFASLSGMIWGKLEWGDIGLANRDPRFVSILFVLIIYSAYFILFRSVAIQEQAKKIAALYAAISLPFATFFMFVMPRILKSQHPENPIFNIQKSEDSIRIPFGLNNILIMLSSAIACLLLAYCLYKLRSRISKLERVWAENEE